MDTPSDKLKLFCMKNLLLEADLVKLEENGIEIQHKETIKKDDIIDPDLFDSEIRMEAKRMSDFYAL